tara:strand:- start:1710 stop:1892 length:183 start_codon:yes stop_codon:yes gene_type:complete
MEIAEVAFQVGVGALGALVTYVWRVQASAVQRLEDRLREVELDLARLEATIRSSPSSPAS